MFSPGHGLAGFPQEKLKWRIKTKKMRPLGRRGAGAIVWINKRHDIKWVKVFHFVAFTFIAPTHVPLHRKLLLRIVNTSSAILDQVGTSCNRQFGVRAQVLRTAPRVFCNFVPLMFLQGPYFSEEGALGLPKAKSLWEHWILKEDVFVHCFTRV